MKPLHFTQHVKECMASRGSGEEEVREVIAHGPWKPAKEGAVCAVLDFHQPFVWQGRPWVGKSVEVRFIEENTCLKVITVIVRWFS